MFVLTVEVTLVLIKFRHVSVNDVGTVKPEITWLPFTATLPLQPPLAVHDDAFDVDHDRVTESGDSPDVWRAVNVSIVGLPTVGTVTITVSLALALFTEFVAVNVCVYVQPAIADVIVEL